MRRVLLSLAAATAAVVGGFLFLYRGEPGVWGDRPWHDTVAADSGGRASPRSAPQREGPPAGTRPAAGGGAREGRAESEGGDGRRGSDAGYGAMEGGGLAARARALGPSAGVDSTDSERLRRRRSEISGFVSDLPHGGAGGANAEVYEDAVAEKSGDPDVVLSVPLAGERGTLPEKGLAPSVEQDLEFDADGEGVRFGRSSVLAFPDAGNLSGEAGTLMLDIEPEWSGAEAGDYALITVRNPNDPTQLLRVFKNGIYLRFVLAGESGQEFGVGTNIEAWQPGEPHRVAVTWGEDGPAMYIDGRMIGQSPSFSPMKFRSGTPLYLGSDIPEAGPIGAGGTISSFRAYGRALTPDEVAGKSTK